MPVGLEFIKRMFFLIIRKLRVVCYIDNVSINVINK